MTGNKKNTILITGGNGFLGSNIVKALIDQYTIIILEKNIDAVSRLQEIKDKLILIDVDDVNLDQIFIDYQIDIIIHTATIYGRNQESIDQILTTNLALPLKLITVGIQHQARVFINTDTVLDKFVSPYALTKSHLRDWLTLYSNKIKVVNLQLEHFYGPGGSMDNFISLMITKMLNNESEIALTEGKQLRDFVYFKDVVSAYLTIIDNLDDISEQFSNYQIASGEVISIRDLVECIKRITNSSSELKFGELPYRPNELMHPETDNSKLVNLGWHAKVDLDSGLLETIEYIKKK
ncbi:MAG: NAD-dependent epimerase/dehydratase family protein [Bacteroidetes bacterium]|nr:NAD-dependent epimerase/dehydratase family protein [Bacteroidota bacterium]